MIHIVGSRGIIGLHLAKRFEYLVEVKTHMSGDWNFSSVVENDLVFYLRSVSSPFKVMIDPVYSREINVDKTKVAISRMIGAGARIVFASSDVVYGDTQDSFVDEFTPVNPYGEYANQKISVEDEFKNEKNFLSLRISSVIGEGSNLRKLLLSQDAIEIFDPVIRTPIHIVDLGNVCNGLIKSNFRQDFPNGILNVGGSKSMSIFEISLLEAKALAVKSPVATHRSTLDKECRPGTVRMLTTKAQKFANLSLDLNQHYE